ncbi:PQ-loop repeat-containing protein 2 [Naviculisporaceae sp. PSN 640]
MAPPTQLLNLDVEAISGICGSISIACWVVVFSPQIVENFRRSSADGLSIQFIIVWLLGDVFNILGAVLQGVLPTMIILAIYYTIADVVLLAQCFYYRGFTWKDSVDAPEPRPPTTPLPKPGHAGHLVNERTALLSATRRDSDYYDGAGDDDTLAIYHTRERRGSDWSHLNPAVPLVLPEELEAQAVAAPPRPPSPPTKLQSFLFNLLAVLMVCAAGVAGWWLSRDYSTSSDHHNDHSSPSPPPKKTDEFEFNFWGQVFGWLCAALYLGSRLPQLLLNFRRKSTEGVSILFFLFACLGNLTYVMSILAFEPDCSSGTAGTTTATKGGENECAPGQAAHIYGEYILVNLSWLAGSAGTLFLDFAIFVQFFLYNKETDEGDDEEDEGYESDERTVEDDGEEEEEEEEEESIIGGGGSRRQQRRGQYYDQRPVLDRGLSDFTR